MRHPSKIASRQTATRSILTQATRLQTPPKTNCQEGLPSAAPSQEAIFWVSSENISRTHTKKMWELGLLRPRHNAEHGVTPEKKKYRSGQPNRTKMLRGSRSLSNYDSRLSQAEPSSSPPTQGGKSGARLPFEEQRNTFPRTF